MPSSATHAAARLLLVRTAADHNGKVDVMKAIFRLAVAAIASIAVATVAAAQHPSAVLNSLEVQKFVAADTPIANLRLAVHFNAVAARFVTDAERHKAIGTVYVATAQRSLATSIGRHSERQAAIATEWAAAAHALAAYHVDLARGRMPGVPKGAAELQAGRGAPEPTAEQLHKLALSARTRTDHLALQEYYMNVAGKRAAEAEEHLRIATGYRAVIWKGAWDPAATRQRLARLARQAATRATEAANRHRQLATIA